MINHTKVSLNDWIGQMEGNIVSDMDGEKVMLSIENGIYYNLGDIGGEIWELMESPLSVNDLILQLLHQFDVSKKECEQEVLHFLNHLLENKLIKIYSTSEH